MTILDLLIGICVTLAVAGAVIAIGEYLFGGVEID